MATHDHPFGNGYPPSIEQENLDYATAVTEGVANALMWARDLDGFFDGLEERIAEHGGDAWDPDVVRDIAEEYVLLFTYDRAHLVDLQGEAPAVAAARFERSLSLRGIEHWTFAEFLRRKGVLMDAATAEHVDQYYGELGAPFRSGYDDYEPEEEIEDDYEGERPLDELISAVLDAITPKLLADEGFLDGLSRRIHHDSE